MKLLRIFKMAVAFCIAMVFAQYFHFQYAPSAGIVAILTIQNTKKETFLICLKRVLSFMISLISALIVFSFFGYSALSFSVFLFIFVGLSFLFHLEDGIAMNAVITTHYLIEQSMSLYWIQNEMAIFMIGISVGIIINLYMPSRQKKIQQSLQQIDMRIRQILLRMSQCLLKDEKNGTLFVEFDRIFKMIEDMLLEAYEQMNNQLLNDTKYAFEYLRMRKEQLLVLKDIYHLMVQIHFHGKQFEMVSNYLKNMALEYHEDNDVLLLKEQFDHLKQQFQQDTLPLTRDEFENRALLFTMLIYLEKFLNLKNQFYHQRD